MTAAADEIVAVAQIAHPLFVPITKCELIGQVRKDAELQE